MAKNLIQLSKGSKSYGTKLLLDGATFSINEGEHVGVIGPNGAGKSTMFKLLVGEEELDSGQVVKSSELRLAYLKQDSQWATDDTLQSLVEDASLPYWQIEKLALGMGISLENMVRPLDELSGGFRMRCQLVYLLAQEPNLLLLDEPTNYLDLETLIVLENTLQGFEGAFLLISHDREFLKRTTHYTLEIEQADVTKYNGHIEDYFEQKAMLREQMLATQSQQLKKKAHLESFINRFRAKASKAKQAQSKLKQLNKMEVVSVKSLPVQAKINIPEPEHSPKKLFELSDIHLGYESGIDILSNVDLIIEKGQHLAVVGYNGAGKSTLLKALAGQLKPSSGSLIKTEGIEFSYFSQHVHEQLDDEMTVFEELQGAAHPDVTRQQVLDTAGSLLFAGDDVQKKIKWLSGGERMRVALGQILLSKTAIMLLDEPTNHLDFHTVEALTHALKAYNGALLVVSHDRSFIAQIATKIIEVRDGSVLFYPGSYDEYVWSLQKGMLSNASSKVENEVSKPQQDRASQVRVRSSSNHKMVKKKLRDLEKKIAQIEIALNRCKKELDSINEEIILESDSKKQLELVKNLEEVQLKVSELEQNWLEHHQSQDELQAELSSH
tara:strand:- start:123514 stop:125340 length:1827 start_codon:yes stop_codon:yes gene_type:complete